MSPNEFHSSTQRVKEGGLFRLLTKQKLELNGVSKWFWQLEYLYLLLQIPISRTISVFVDVLKSNIKEFKSVNGVESR